MSVSADHFVFCPPILGVPDPKEPRILTAEGLDSRSRVIQKGVPNLAGGVHGVFNLMRDHYEAPNTQKLRGRIIEQICFNRYEAWTALQEKVLQKTVDEAQLSEEMTKMNEQFFTQIEKVFPTMRQHVNALIQGMLLAFKMKMGADFVENKNIIFIGNQNINDLSNAEIEENIGNAILTMKAQSIDVNDAKTQDAMYTLFAAMESNFVNHVMALVYGLKISPWLPSDKVEDLIKELRSHGPLAVAGLFGTPFYKNEPKKRELTAIKTRDVFYWTKDDKKAGQRGVYMILIVGAEKNKEGEFVYYIDPKDDSDPSHPEKQRIYMMTYKTLTSGDQICCSVGYAKNEMRSPIGYAYYKEKPTPTLSAVAPKAPYEAKT